MSKQSEDQIKDYYQALPKPQLDGAKQDRLWEKIDNKIDSGFKQKPTTKWIVPKKLIAGIAVVLLALLIFSPELMHSSGMTMASSLKSFVENSPLLKGKKILTTKGINNGVLFFYKPEIQSAEKPESQLAAVFVKRTFLGGWHLTNYRGGYSSGIKKSFYIDYFPSGKSGLPPLLFGEVKDSKIHRLYIYGKDKQHELPITISITSYGKKNQFVIWYAFVDPSKGPTYTIVAKDGNENVVASETYNIQSHSKTITTISSLQAIDKVIDKHPDFPKTPGTKKLKLPTGGPKGSFANVDFTTSVKKKSASTFIVTFTKDWHLTVNGTYVKSIWKYQVTPFDVKTLEVKDLDHLPNEMK